MRKLRRAVGAAAVEEAMRIVAKDEQPAELRAVFSISANKRVKTSGKYT